MSTNSFLGHDVDLERLAELTRNFSGAEIEGLVKSAASYALNRNVDINDLHKPLDEDNIKVCTCPVSALQPCVAPAGLLHSGLSTVCSTACVCWCAQAQADTTPAGQAAEHIRG